MELDIMANVVIRSIRNGTGDEATIVNHENPKKKANRVTVLGNEWVLCEINIPLCESAGDWHNNHRISVDMKHAQDKYQWIFQNNNRICYCSTTAFSDMRPVEGDPEVSGDEDRYLAIKEDGKIVIVKVSFLSAS